MNRDPLNQPAPSGASNPEPSRLSQPELSLPATQSSMNQSSSMGPWAPNRKTPPAVANTRPSTTFAITTSTSTAPTPAVAANAGIATTPSSAQSTAPTPAAVANAGIATTPSSVQSSPFANMATIYSPQSHSAVEYFQPPAATQPSHVVLDLLIRGLPANMAQNDLQYLITAFEIVGISQSADYTDGPVAPRTRKPVLVQVKTLDTVTDIQKKVNDMETKLNARGATVELVRTWRVRSSRPSSNGTSPATRPASTSQAATRSGGAVFPLPTPTTNGSHVRNGNGNGNSNGNGHGFNMPQTPYSSQSPIGNHLNHSQPRVSSRDLIMDDDGTSDFMNLPLYQTQNGSNLNSRAHENRPANTTAPNGQGRYADTTPSQRRATVPHLGVSTLDAHMASLSIHNGTNGTPAAQRGNVSMYSQSLHPGIMSVMQSNMQTAHQYPFNRRIPPAANPADQNPPCNTLYVGNLPVDAQEEEIRQLFSVCRGYKRMCYRIKNNGPMCFVEFDDTSCATRAMEGLYGFVLPTCKKGGLRLSFSKNPLGMRSPQAGGPHGAMVGHHSMMGHNQNGFTTATGPPPGLPQLTAPPPGLGPISPSSYPVPTSMANIAMTNGNGIGSPNASNMANGTSYAFQTTNSHNNNALGMGTANGYNMANGTSYASRPTNGNADNNNALGMGTANGYNMANGTSHASQYANGNNAPGNGLGNGTSVDHRSQQSFTGSWPRSFNATPAYMSAHYGYAPPHTSASVGNGFNSYARNSRPAQP